MGMAPLSAAIIVHSIATFMPTPRRDLSPSARTSVWEVPEHLLLMERSRPERTWLCLTTLRPIDSNSLRMSRLKFQTPGSENPGWELTTTKFVSRAILLANLRPVSPLELATTKLLMTPSFSRLQAIYLTSQLLQ